MIYTGINRLALNSLPQTFLLVKDAFVAFCKIDKEGSIQYQIYSNTVVVV